MMLAHTPSILPVEERQRGDGGGFGSPGVRLIKSVGEGP